MEDNTPQLTITDLAVLKNCIDIAATRGAFRAPEMKAVGEVYEKLSNFLSVVVSQAESEQGQDNPQGEQNA